MENSISKEKETLKSIAIELKTGKFLPEYAGKMNFYLTALNETMKYEDENPAIGIIIYKSKNRTIVEYALKNNNQPVGVGTYTIQDQLPSELQKYLPSQEELISSIEKLRGELRRHTLTPKKAHKQKA